MNYDTHGVYLIGLLILVFFFAVLFLISEAISNSTISRPRRDSWKYDDYGNKKSGRDGIT